MVSFHLPPTARNAACSGQWASGCGGAARYAPAGAFLSLDMDAPSVWPSIALEDAMTDRRRGWISLLAALMLAGAPALPAPAQYAKPAPPRDGSHAFDLEIGPWKTHLKRLLHPLSGSDEWAEDEGITTVRKVWDGRASLVELVADGPAGHFEGLNLRLYNPQSGQWSLNFASIR